LTAQEHALITRASQSARRVRRFMQWDAAGGDDAVEATRDHMIALGGGGRGKKPAPPGNVRNPDIPNQLRTVKTPHNDIRKPLSFMTPIGVDMQVSTHNNMYWPKCRTSSEDAYGGKHEFTPKLHVSSSL